LQLGMVDSKRSPKEDKNSCVTAHSTRRIHGINRSSAIVERLGRGDHEVRQDHASGLSRVLQERKKAESAVVSVH